MIPLPEPEIGYQTWAGQCRGAYTADQMHAHAAAARRQALEEVTHACEAIALDHGRAWDCVRRIRELIDKDAT